MTREELIEALTLLKDQAQEYGDNTFVWSINIDSFNFVIESTIKALEQEPILDKITEIIEPLRHLSIDEMSDIEWDILRVIDKYKAESEVEDGNNDN